MGGRPAQRRAQWRTRAAQMGLTNLTLTGFVPNRHIPLYQAAAEILLMPYETSVSVSGGGNTADICSPMKMFEYMAAGRRSFPPIYPFCTKCSTPRAPFFARRRMRPPGCRLSARWRQDGELRARLGTAARAAVQGYSWQKRAQKSLEAFFL